VRKRRLGQGLLGLVVLAGLLVSIQSPAAAATQGPFIVVQPQSGKCLDVPNSTTSDVAMIIYTCGNPRRTNQQWNFVDTGGGNYWIQNRLTNKCLTVWGARIDDNISVIQYACNTGDNEEWYSESVVGYSGDPHDYYRIRNVNSDKCLQVKGAGTVNNTILVQLECDSIGIHDEQWWTWYA